MGFYKWLYTHLTPWIKRPWTFFTRDLWANAEYIFIVGFTAVGFFLGFYWEAILNYLALHPILVFACSWGLFTIGFILGHIFWGTRYIPNEGGEK